METLKRKVGRPKKEVSTQETKVEKVQDRILKCNDEIQKLRNELKEQESILHSRVSKIYDKLRKNYQDRIDIYESQKEHLKNTLLNQQMKPYQMGLILLMERTRWGSGTHFGIIKKPKISWDGDCSGFEYNKIGTSGIGSRTEFHWLDGEYSKIVKVVCSIQEFSTLCKEYKIKPTLNNKTLEKLFELRFKERVDSNTFSYNDLEKLGIIVK